MRIQAKLIEVQGNQEEFADLIGETGELHLEPSNDWFLPQNSNDTLTMSRKRFVDKDCKITISTALGNKFVFRPINRQ